MLPRNSLIHDEHTQASESTGGETRNMKYIGLHRGKLGSGAWRVYRCPECKYEEHVVVEEEKP